MKNRTEAQKVAHAAYMREWYWKNREKALANSSKSAKKCRKKIMETQAIWNANNPDRVAKYKKDWADKNIERNRIRRAEYWKANPGKKLALVRKRQAAKLHRTPAWADFNAIREIYEKAAQMRKDGFDVEVDHVIPLLGKNVSGLHVPANLAIIPTVENRKKMNKFSDN